jgi:tRNA1(Val) A37 N6-methylase TrmN6
VTDTPLTTTADTLLDGRVLLRQPERGYRVAIDPILLAAAVPAGPGERIVELGLGVGAASLCLATRVPHSSILGVELQPALAALARANVAANRLDDRVTVVEGDATKFAAETPFDHVMANPPFGEAGTGSNPPDPGKQTATVEGDADLAEWAVAALTLARPGGTVTFIHRASRLFDLLREIAWLGAGAVVVFPLWPKAGVDAKRVIVQARPGRRTPLRIAPGLVLHEADGSYTAAARAILREGQALPL